MKEPRALIKWKTVIIEAIVLSIYESCANFCGEPDIRTIKPKNGYQLKVLKARKCGALSR